MNALKSVLIFGFGAAIGSVVTWKVLKSKYEKIAQEEIDSVKETFSRVYEHKDENEVVEKEPEPTPKFATTEKPDIMEYAAKLHKEGYTNYSKSDSDERKNDEMNEMNMEKKPYVIPPEDFGEYEDYTIMSLSYYKDGILTDEQDNPIAKGNIESLIGDALEHFGEYEDDAVYVRDDRLEIDYEILLEIGNYHNVVTGKSHSTED